MWNKLGLFVVALLIAWHLFRSAIRIAELGREMQWHLDRREFFSGWFAEERIEWRLVLFLVELWVLVNVISFALGGGCVPRD